MISQTRIQRQTYMFDKVEQYLQGSEGIRLFSRRICEKRTTLHYWIKKHEYLKGIPSSSIKSEAKSFIPIHLSSMPSTVLTAELSYPNGITLKLGGINDLHEINQLVSSYHV
jgi:hypothetical protein